MAVCAPFSLTLTLTRTGIGNAVRCKLSKHHLTLVLCTTVSVAAACLVYAGCLKIAEMTCGINVQHEAGYICSMLFIIPGFPFITSGIDLVQQMITRGNVSSAMRMPMWIVYIVLPLASGIFTLRLIAQVVQDIKALFGHGSDNDKEVA